MTQRLVPDFIIDNYALGQKSGDLRAVGLFMDVSGFTAATEALMAFGHHGAEVMAEIMGAIFDPLVHNVYAHGGFVANFAGDAFTAVFPINSHNQQKAVVIQALAVAWRSQLQLKTIRRQKTVYGDFEFSVKVGLAIGSVSWGILESLNQQKAAYYFKGTAVTGCTDAEHLAKAGDIIAGPGVLALLNDTISFEKVADHGRITAVHIDLPPAQPVNLPPVNLTLTSRFFPSVIFEQAVSGEFRLVFNLFINLQGSPSLSEITRFMEIFFALQEKYGGLSNRIDYGDKGCHILVFWGVPRSYENDIQRVANFLLDLQAKSFIPFRAGLTYRIAHAGFSGSSIHHEYTCYGRGVNMAARFMTSSNWGEIWVDDETATRLMGRFKTKFVDFMTFKGFAEPQPVFALTGDRRRSDPAIYRNPLTGRDKELRQLEFRMAPLQNGRFAGAVTVIGEAGIGKSRLVSEFLEHSDILDFAAVFTCQTDEILRQSLNPFRYFLHEYFDQSNRQTESVNKERFNHVLDRLIEDLQDRNLKADLQQSRSFLGALLDLYWPDSPYERLEPQVRFENTLAALKTFFKAESRRQPILILVEDAQWLDGDSREFLGRLARNIDHFPIMLIITSRRPIQPGLFEATVLQTEVALGHFGAKETAVLAQSILQTRPTEQLINLLMDRAEGNPFFIEQLLLYLKENDLIEKIAANKTDPRLDDLGIPTDVRSLLIGRIDRLSLPVKNVLQAASVLGREFEVDIVAQMDNAGADLSSILEIGVNDSIWFVHSENRYQFRHHLLRDAAYDMQLRSRQKKLHHQAALAYETTRKADLAPHFGQIAYHFDRAEVVVKAKDYYQRAADHARDNYRNTEAWGHYSRALDLTTDPETQYILLLEREAINSWLARRSEQKADLDHLLAIAADNRKKQTAIGLRFAAYELVMGNYEAALAQAQQALELAQQIRDASAHAQAYHRIGRIHWQQGLSKTAVPYLEQALSTIQAAEDPQTVAKCLYDLSVCHFYQSNFGEAEKYIRQARSAYQPINDKRGEMNCLNVLGIIQHRLGRYSAAAQYYEQSLSLCRDVGWPYAETQYLLNLGSIRFELGDYETARDFLEQALSVCREIGDKVIESTSLDTLGLIYHYLGEFEQAVSYYEQALDIEKEIKNQRNLGFVLTHLGYSLAEMGAYETAVSTLQQAQQIRETLGDEGGLIDTKTGLLYTAYLSKNSEQARELAVEISIWLETNDPASLELPIQVYLIVYRALQEDPTRQAAALEAGYTLLQKNAAHIQDETLRRQFLEQVLFNRDLSRHWRLAG